MSDRRIARLLRDVPVPDESGAEARAWRVLRAAHAELRQEPSRAPEPRRSRRLALALATGFVLVAVLLSPAGAAVRDWFGDVVEPGRKDARPALTSLPGGGRLLVGSVDGVWVVDEDGSKRLLGPYRQAAWSPRGKYVVAARADQLTAIEPDGDVRWTLSRNGAVADPRWSPSGYRVAYRSGRSLRVVAGDGSPDARLASKIAPVAPAWRPLQEQQAGLHPDGPGTHIVGFVDDTGRVVVLDTDTRVVLWRSPTIDPAPSELQWAPDGRTLLAIAGPTTALKRLLGLSGRVISFEADGRLIGRRRLPGGVAALSFRPGGSEFAISLVRGSPQGPRSEVRLVNAGGAGRRLFAGQGVIRDLAFSPDGSLLLLGWRDADQWLFLPVDARGGAKIAAFDQIGREFDPGGSGQARFPRVEGWCCSD